MDKDAQEAQQIVQRLAASDDLIKKGLARIEELRHEALTNGMSAEEWDRQMKEPDSTT
jgi:hypothetical protein